MKHGKITCDANRPKELEEYGFEVPERLRETLVPVALPQMQLWPWLTHQEEEFLDPIDWETKLFSELGPDKIFHPWDTPVLPRETRTPFSTLVKDLNFSYPD